MAQDATRRRHRTQGLEPRVNRSGRIHWGRIVVAAFLAEASVMAGFFLLLVAHAMKILGGITGGLVAEKRTRRVVAYEAAHV
jgi:hypothetical protein